MCMQVRSLCLTIAFLDPKPVLKQNCAIWWLKTWYGTEWLDYVGLQKDQTLSIKKAIPWTVSVQVYWRRSCGQFWFN